MTKIFISYRRDDSADATGRIYDRLERHFGRDAIFMDVDAIPLGVNFKLYIDQQVAKCNVLLAIIGENWLTASYHDGPQKGKRRLDDPADFVRLEIQFALTKNLFVIPVLVGKAQFPNASLLPEPLKELANLNAAEVRSGKDFDVHVNRLLRGIEYLKTHGNEYRRSAPKQSPLTRNLIRSNQPVSPVPKKFSIPPGIRIKLSPELQEEYERHSKDLASNSPTKQQRLAGRNDPCPCGSNKKYKNCCMTKLEAGGT
jgi:hypothetical protein